MVTSKEELFYLGSLCQTLKLTPKQQQELDEFFTMDKVDYPVIASPHPL